MHNRQVLPFIFAENFKGVNAKDSQENIAEGEWDKSSTDIFSDPEGTLGSRPGFTSLTTASIGSVTAWCGFYQFDKHSGGSTTSTYLGGGEDGKVYKFASNEYEELFDGLGTANADDERFSFFTLDNTCVICQSKTTPLVYTGTGSAATFATSVTADWGLEWQRYGWLHSTVDPRLLYYCTTLGDPDSAYTSFINFDDDGEKVVGACKHGDDMLVGKQNALYVLEYRGTTPLFKKNKLEAKIGPVCHWVMKELPDGRVVFMGIDANFYMVIGNHVVPCGDNIKNYVKAGVKARFQYAVAGLLYARNQYWCSFTYTSGVTQNDRTVVMDWSRPYEDKWGKIQYPWFIYTIGANCFAEVSVSGEKLLYHGGYVGKMYKDDTGTNDDGSAFSPTYRSKRISHGDPTLEKKYSNINLALERSGDWDLNITAICDGNAGTEKSLSVNLLAGLGYQSLYDVAKYDEDYYSTASDMDTTKEIMRQGKLIEISMGTTGLDESWRVYHYTLHARPLRRGIRSR